MQKYYTDREAFGPEFDDRLIRLVRKNPAIYDVSHPHYRRNPVRVAIWERIAAELGAPSKFLQTKWKNIRYNYLQEVKCLETGHTNANIRKRRFTEDLTFLQHTAQTYNVKKGLYSSLLSENDNDSNGYTNPDPESADADPHAFEVIEIEHSDDGGDDSQLDFSACNDHMNNTENSNEKKFNASTLLTETKQEVIIKEEPTPGVTIKPKVTTRRKSDTTHIGHSNPSSPLLTPLVVMGNGANMCETNGEVTIEAIPKQSTPHRTRIPASEIMENAAKRKAMPAPFPVLTPINDPIELYCLSLVDSLRNMPRSERERVKYEFAKILKDAKYMDQC